MMTMMMMMMIIIIIIMRRDIAFAFSAIVVQQYK